MGIQQSQHTVKPQTRTRNVHSKPITDPNALGPMVLGNHHRIHMLGLCKMLVGTGHVH
jgi:hypothetical protein